MQRNEIAEVEALLNKIQCKQEVIKMDCADLDPPVGFLEKRLIKLANYLETLEESPEIRNRLHIAEGIRKDLVKSLKKLNHSIDKLANSSRNKDVEHLRFYSDVLEAVHQCSLDSNADNIGTLRCLADTYAEFTACKKISLFEHRQSPVSELKHIATVAEKLVRLAKDMDSDLDDAFGRYHL